MPLLKNSEGETPQTLGYPAEFMDADGNKWVQNAIQTDPSAVEYKIESQPNTSNIPSV